LVAATTEWVHHEGPVAPGGVDEDGVVVVVVGLHRAQQASRIGDLGRVAIEDGAVAALEPGPQLIEGEAQGLDGVRRPGQ
jgi:hypothetical protein